MEKATLAIAVITMLIALGQLILAYIALDKRRARANARWRRPNIDWLLIGLTMTFAFYGMSTFQLNAPFEKLEVYYFGAYVLVASMGFSMFVLKLGLIHAAKRMALVHAESAAMEERLAYLERRLRAKGKSST